MPDSGSEGVKLPLLTVAHSFVQLGFSIIPVYGNSDPARGKISMVDWKPFQQRRASYPELVDWFERRQAPGMAIVTGRISALAVLDFDSPALAALFGERLPHLTDTRVILSAKRGLPHFYFRLPPTMHTVSRKLPGVDWQSDGCYVVTAPTELGDSAYRVERGGMPRLLTHSDLERIQRFLNEIAQVQFHTAPTAAPEDVPCGQLTTQQIIQAYRVLLPIGRNNALFRAGVKVRDDGWSFEQAAQVLVPLHCDTRIGTETLAQRAQEAERTLRSVYTRARRVKPQPAGQGLPNALREKLLAQQQLALVRVLDALHPCGIAPSALVTEKILCDRLEGVVGRYSILQALQAKLPDGAVVFARENPFPTPHTFTDVASQPIQDDSYCNKIGVTASDKKGRPARIYRVPLVSELCQRLGIRFTTGAALTLDALRSPARYRQALHCELVKRAPGEYPLKWHSKRLNVSERTCQRYNRTGEIVLTPVYTRVAITYNTLHLLGQGRHNHFLEDMDGKRYPALPDIGKRLMARGKMPTLMIQGFNHYQIGASIEGREARNEYPGATGEGQGMRDKNGVAGTIRTGREWLKDAPQATLKRFETNRELESTKPQKTPQIAPERPESGLQALFRRAMHYRLQPRQYYWRPLADQRLETAAQNLVEFVQRYAQQVTRLLSLATARKLLEQYGDELLQHAMTILRQRTNVQNPAGFLVSWLRSETTVIRLAS